MKTTGIVRPVDNLGRLVIPIELRRTLDINEGDGLEIYVDGKSIVLRKYEPTCIFCGNSSDLILYQDRHICRGRLARESTESFHDEALHQKKKRQNLTGGTPD